MLNDEILQLKSYDEQTGREISNVFPITNLEAVKVDNDTNLKEKLTEIGKQIEQTNSSLDAIDKKMDSYIENNNTIADNDKVDYMGGKHNTLKDTNDANINYLLRKLNTQKYEGSSITANNTYAKQVSNVILKGVTKYKDLNTDDFLDRFEEGRNLELIGSKGSVIQIKNKLTAQDLICTFSKNMSCSVDNNTLNMSSGPRWARACFTFDYQAGTVYNVSFYSKVPGNYCVDFNRDNSNRTFFSEDKFTKDFTPVGEQPLQICDIKGYSKMVLSEFYICKSQYKNEPYKASELILPLGNTLYSIGDTYDYIDLNTGVYVKNIDIRSYQDGDENNDEVMTDRKNTIYKLGQPIITKIDLQGQKVYSYDGTTYYTCNAEMGYPTPILSIDIPTDVAALVHSQQNEIKSLNIENIKLKAINDVQDELIDTTMLATDEIYNMLEPLLVSTLSETSTSKIVDMYVAMVKRRLKHSDEIPTKYKEYVKNILDHE